MAVECECDILMGTMYFDSINKFCKENNLKYMPFVGIVNKRKGYKEGRVIRKNKLITGTGGGLCNLANTINNLILHSLLQIVEFHKHSDALASDI